MPKLRRRNTGVTPLGAVPHNRIPLPLKVQALHECQLVEVLGESPPPSRSPESYLRSAYKVLKQRGFDITTHENKRKALMLMDKWVKKDKLKDAKWHASEEKREQQRREYLNRHHEALVYYARNGDLVKIGTTTDIKQRSKALFPAQFMALEFGSYERERRRHKQFDALRVQGEWFRLDESLAAHIVELRDKFERTQEATVEAWLAERLPRPKRR